MKILFVSNDSSLLGSSKSMINLVKELKSKNNDIYVIIPKKGVIEEELIKLNINYKIFRYYSWTKPMGEKSYFKYLIKIILTLISSINISRWVKKNKIEIIHSNNSATYVGCLISILTKKKHIWHIRELMQEDHNLDFFNKAFTYRMLNSADYLIYISKAVKDKYDKLLTNKNSKLVYNGIPVDKFLNAKIPEFNKNKIKLLIAGHVCKTKGQEEAIKAIEYLRNKGINNLELQIAGDGVIKEQLEKYVIENKLEDNVKFLGFRNDLDEIRKQINIYLMCSQNEAFGRVTVEAMMSKNLVIGSNTGGTVELITHKNNGFLYKQGDYKDLADKIEYAIKNWDKCEKVIENAYVDAMNNYSIQRCANEVLEVYKKVIEGDKKCIK